MGCNKQQYETHTFKSFLENYHVTIPMVQRDYAQGRNSVEVNRVRDRFLSAIKGYLMQPDSDYEVMKLDFVYGEKEILWSKTEINKPEKKIVTPLDGQQRLTTLFLLYWYAAKRNLISQKDYAFLKHFTYDIRPSSRDFCTHLIEFTPLFNSSIADQLIDQYWFMGDWHNDPTILSMLNMIDAIKDKFSDVDNLWSLLTREGEDARIVFFFLPLAENGLSDELYIKMNSRGKKLTPFEHFKAEFEDLYERDTEESLEINHKFDVEWADMLFSYRDSDDLIDNEFMRYFYYISHILCYQQSIEKSTDEFELIKVLYKESPYAIQNRKFFEKAMDCWYKVKEDFGTIGMFFAKYLTQSGYEDGKVATYKTIKEYRTNQTNQNFFHACIKLYMVNNNFSYSDFLFLYGIITYLLNKTDIEETAFIDRLRILRNLIWNSNSGEIRGDSDYMKDLLTEVEMLMLQGRIKSDLKHGFNGFQEAEENDKMTRKIEMSSEELKKMYKYEDHPLIYGYVSGLGYDHLDLVDTFYDVFDNNSYQSIHLALIAIGDYMQYDNYTQYENRRRYYMGNSNRSTWTQLLHKSRNRDNFEKSMSVLTNLLRRVQNGESITDIRDSFIKRQEELQEYTWRYYFAKYPEMLRGADGELVWKDDSSAYLCTTLNRHQFNGQHWNSFLNVIYQKVANELDVEYKTKILNIDNYGGNLTLYHPLSSISTASYGFDYFYQEDKEPWKIKQNEDGIDTEDRVLLAIEKIKSIISKNSEEPNTSD